MKIAFVSSNFQWGGSEFLWRQAACLASRSGHHVTAFTFFEVPQKERTELITAGVKVFRWSTPDLLSRLKHRLRQPAAGWQTEIEAAHVRQLADHRPDLVVLSQGGNFDGPPFAEACMQHALPYALLANQAGERYWPTDRIALRMAAAYASARHCWFVSKHNLELTEWQIGSSLPHASVIRHAIQVPAQVSPTWPTAEPSWRMACMARLTVHDKGQDLLIRLFSQDKWRGRPIRLSLYGRGYNEQSLRGMAAMLGVAQVEFTGQTDNLVEAWNQHHAILLPSREEGLPLALVEAMMCHRMAVVTKVAGNPEVVDDGETGFIAAAPTVEHLDEALERAWLARDRWQAMGMEAGRRIRSLMPVDPVGVFLEDVLRVAMQVVG